MAACRLFVYRCAHPPGRAVRRFWQSRSYQKAGAPFCRQTRGTRRETPQTIS